MYFISMKKQEYIEKFGQEAWDKKQESHRRASRKWLEKPENKERAYATTRKWQKDNKENMKKIRDNFNANHPLYDNAHCKKYQSTKKGRAATLLHAYKQSDSINNRGECKLTRSWIVDRIFSTSCIYCGDSSWEHLGADRIDNNLPHTPDNCVCACGICNIERQYKELSVDEFKEYRKANPRECDKVKTNTLLGGCTE